MLGEIVSNNNYDKPALDELNKNQLLMLALKYKNNPDYPYMEEIFNYYTENHSEIFVNYWPKIISTYMHKSYQYIINSHNSGMLYLTALHNTYSYKMDDIFDHFINICDVRKAADWFMNIPYARNKELKLLALRNNKVEKFIVHIKTITTNYSPNNFYSDLPVEYQIGIII